jgi:hypothetical protein
VCVRVISFFQRWKPFSWKNDVEKKIYINKSESFESKKREKKPPHSINLVSARVIYNLMSGQLGRAPNSLRHKINKQN